MTSNQSDMPRNDGDGSLRTPRQPKRQGSNVQQSNRSKSSSGKKRKTRNAEDVPDGRLKSPWQKGLPVWVNCYDERGNREWKEGIVAGLEESSTLNQYKIKVHVQDENGEWTVQPRTYNQHNRDAIPTNSTRQNYQLRDYIQTRNEELDGVPEMTKLLYKCIQLSSRKGSQSLANSGQEMDVVGKVLLDDDQRSPTAIRNILISLMDHDDVKKIVNAVTGSSEVCVQYALAFILGQLCGIEICEAESADDTMDPQQLLKTLVGSTTTNTTDNVKCPISQIFLMSNMTARTKKYKKYVPNGALFDSRGKEPFDDPEKLKIRMKRLQTALAAIHSSQYESPKISGPSSALLLHGIQLMIDMRGTSDSLLNKLADEGVCRPAKVIRLWIQKLADSIEPLNTRTAVAGMSHVVANTADNADFHMMGTCKSVVPGGTISLGMEPDEDSIHFNREYMRGLGKMSDVKVEKLMATKEEDTVAQEVIDNQNIAAILMAAMEYNNIPKRSTRNRSSDSTKPSAGDDVTFTYRSKQRRGRVEKTAGKNATVAFTDGSRQVSRLIPLNQIEKLIDATNTDAGPQATEDTATAANEVETVHQPPEMFDGQRHRFNPSTTSIAYVLTGLSSKNTETARQVVQQVINQYGEDKFNEAVHVIVADQEFMPTIISDFFARLREDDNKLHILPALAMGHVMKGLSVSMMSFYKSFFDPILEGIGIKVGSPRHAKLYKGAIIRDTNEVVTESIEMAAVAAAHLYLEEVGQKHRIDSKSFGKTTPFTILNAYFKFEDGESMDRTARSVVVMDPHTRPVCIRVTESLKLLATDFQSWAMEKWGTTLRDEVGPSGHIRKSSLSREQQLDPSQLELSNKVENDERYQQYRDMNYFDDGERRGLYSRCKHAGIIGKSSRNDKHTLSKKLFLYEVMNDKEKAIEFGPARVLPKQTNSTGIVLYDLLFGIERYVLVHGHLLTRIRPQDKDATCREWLVFFKALTASTFMRWQPNYQRLTLSFLIQLDVILRHEDKRCIDLALKRIRNTFSVSEWGDSHNCIPVDLLQEFSIVAQTKRIGARNPAAYGNLTSRVKLSSFLRLHEIEDRSRNATSGFPSISQEQAAKAREKLRKRLLIVAFWRGIVNAIDASDDTDASALAKIQGLGNENSDVLFADRSRAYYRQTDATGTVTVQKERHQKSSHSFLSAQSSLSWRQFTLSMKSSGSCVFSPSRPRRNQGDRV